jgi:hypothetical protein
MYIFFGINLFHGFANFVVRVTIANHISRNILMRMIVQFQNTGKITRMRPHPWHWQWSKPMHEVRTGRFSGSCKQYRFVVCSNKPLNRQSHELGKQSGSQVSKIPTGHRKYHISINPASRKRA